MPPASADFREDCFAMLLHVGDESAGRSRLLVPRSPNEQLQKYRRQINSLLRQPVIHPSCIRLLRLRGDDPRRLELPQTVCQDVGGYPLARLLELLKCPEPASHQIADDQQRPAISKHLQGDTHWAAGPTFGLRLPRHRRHLSSITCNMQVISRPVTSALHQALLPNHRDAQDSSGKVVGRRTSRYNPGGCFPRSARSRKGEWR